LVETQGAVGLVEEIARQNGTDYESARKRLYADNQFGRKVLHHLFSLITR